MVVGFSGGCVAGASALPSTELLTATQFPNFSRGWQVGGVVRVVRSRIGRHEGCEVFSKACESSDQLSLLHV